MDIQLKQVPLTDIQPNPWNPHRMTSQEFEALVQSVREDGQWRPIIVVEMDQPDEHTPVLEYKYRIVDGEHLYRALIHLHLEGVWPNAANVIIYGKNSEVPAWKQMEIGQTINHGIRGSIEDPKKTQEILNTILKHRPVEVVAKKLGMGELGVKKVAAAPSKPKSVGAAVAPPSRYKERENYTIALLFPTAEELQEFEELVAQLTTAEDLALPKGRRRLAVIKRCLVQALESSHGVPDPV